MIGEDTSSSHTKKEIRGCVDLGSSYFRLLVLEGTFPPWQSFNRARLDVAGVHDERCYVGWGEDVAVSGAVSPASASLAGAALARLVSRARSLGCRDLSVVGTNTLREARNAAAVISDLEASVSLPVSVLSQRDEARFSFVGAAAFCAEGEALTLVDVGGTSTEISWGKGIEMDGYAGFPLGTHRARLLCGRRSYSPAGLRRAAPALARSLDEIDAAQSRAAGVSRLPLGAEHSTILFTGGTAVSCVVCLRFMRGQRPLFEEMYPLAIEELVLLKRRLTALATAGRERIMPLDRNRMKLLPAGLVLTEALLGHYAVHACNVTARDLRWGVAITGGRAGSQSRIR